MKDIVAQLLPNGSASYLQNTQTKTTKTETKGNGKVLLIKVEKERTLIIDRESSYFENISNSPFPSPIPIKEKEKYLDISTHQRKAASARPHYQVFHLNAEVVVGYQHTHIVRCQVQLREGGKKSKIVKKC